MTILEFPLLSRSEVDTSPLGFYSIFRDKDNGGLLTSKDSNCTFVVIAVSYVSNESVSQISDMADKIISDAGCALSKGIITAEQYESIVDNLNICLEANVDPLTGSYQVCIANTPTIFISLVLTHVQCNGDSDGTVTPTVTGGTAPYGAPVYLDSLGAPANPAALTAGAYTIQVTDANGKTKLSGFVITEPPALSALSSSTPETGAGNDGTATVVVSGGTPIYTYLWNDGGAQTTATATGLAAGAYQCTITDDNGCVLVVPGIIVA